MKECAGALSPDPVVCGGGGYTLIRFGSAGVAGAWPFAPFVGVCPFEPTVIVAGCPGSDTARFIARRTRDFRTSSKFSMIASHSSVVLTIWAFGTTREVGSDIGNPFSTLDSETMRKATGRWQTG